MKIIRDRKGQNIMIKRSILQEHITMLNMYTANNRTSKHIKEKSDKIGKRNRLIYFIVGYIKAIVLGMNISSRQIISKTIDVLNITINELILIVIYKLPLASTATSP